jgi:purine-nucleoside phosphorylase
MRDTSVDDAPIPANSHIAPRVGVILGSGLGAFADELTDAATVHYSDIPGFPHSTAVGHAGKFMVGFLDSLPVAVMAGRAHLYEGYTARQVTRGVRYLHRLGVHALVVTNASGGIASHMNPGDLALIGDHINLQGTNPLVGPNSGFPDMSEAYSARYRDIARSAAHALGVKLLEGVYAALLGPSYETPAEIRYLAAIGADLVGMSTVPEVIVANALGMRVLGISCVTNKAAGLGGKLDHSEVLEAGRNSRETFIRLLRAVLPKLVESDGQPA